MWPTPEALQSTAPNPAWAREAEAGSSEAAHYDLLQAQDAMPGREEHMGTSYCRP